MTIILNGERREVPDRATVADLISDLGRDPRRPGAAVAVNGVTVPRGQWSSTTLEEGDRVEVLGAAQGG